MSDQFLLAVDLGGTKIATCIGTLEGQIIKKSVEKTKSNGTSYEIVAQVISAISNLVNELGIRSKLRGLRIGCPGIVDSNRGVVVSTPNLPWRDLPLKALIEAEFKDVEIFLDNDANCATLAEFHHGAGVGNDNMLYLTVSTGIGAGLILNGSLYRGKDSCAGEIGHMIMERRSNIQCGCGQYGCLETLASGTAIARIAQERLKEGAGSEILKLVKSIEEVDAQIVGIAAKEDGLAKAILNEAFEYLGLAIVNLINTLNVDVIVIGGGVAKLGPLLFDQVRKVVAERLAKSPTCDTPIVPSRLGDEAGLKGALRLVLDSITCHY